MSRKLEQLIELAPEDVVVSDTENCRLTVGDIEALAQSIRTRGQQQPVVVRTVKDRYHLVSGFRRVAAIRALGNNLRVLCVVRDVDAKQARLDNLVENEARQDLSSYEKAAAYARLKSGGLSTKAIAEGVGQSESNVGNLARAWEKLPPDLREEWMQGKPWAKNVAGVIAIAGEKSHAAMRDVAHNTGSKSVGRLPTSRRTKAEIEDQIEALAVDGIEGLDTRSVTIGLSWVLGLIPSLEDGAELHVEAETAAAE